MTNPFAILEKSTGTQSVHVSGVPLIFGSGRYYIGPPTRPIVKHDDGHFKCWKPREPDLSDRLHLKTWEATLVGAEKLCTPGNKIDRCKGDLTDGLAAYRHFLYGNGADRSFDYERYWKNEPTAEQLMKDIIQDFQTHAEAIGENRVKFSITSEPFNVGLGKTAFGKMPTTSNWQKAVGGHFFWISADVAVSANKKGEIIFDATIQINLEDRYNFNCDMKDMANGIPDGSNGRLEITGLGKQYMQFAKVSRSLQWVKGSPATILGKK